MNKYAKLIFAALLIGLGIYMMFFTRNVGWGVVVFLLSAFPIFLFFKNELILLSFWQLRKQNTEKAANWLSKITNYKSQLHKSQYGYFHYLQGLTLAQENPAKVESLMKKALDYGLNMKQDRAMATLNLAAVAISKGRKQEGQRLLEEAKKTGFIRIDDRSDQNDERPTENAINAEAYAQSKYATKRKIFLNFRNEINSHSSFYGAAKRRNIGTKK